MKYIDPNSIEILQHAYSIFHPIVTGSLPQSPEPIFVKDNFILNLLNKENYDVNVLPFNQLTTEEIIEKTKNSDKWNFIKVNQSQEVVDILKDLYGQGNWENTTISETNQLDRTLTQIVSFSSTDSSIYLINELNLFVTIQPLSFYTLLRFFKQFSPFLLRLVNDNENIKYTLEPEKHIENYIETELHKELEKNFRQFSINYEVDKLNFDFQTKIITRNISILAEDIRRAENNIESWKKQIAEAEWKLIFKNTNNDNTQKEKLTQLLTRNKLIKKIEAHSDRLSIFTEPLPMIKYDKLLLKKIIDKDGYNPQFRNVLRKVLDNKATLYFGEYQISILLNASRHELHFNNLHGYAGNPHHKEHNCLGTYQNVLRKALDDQDFALTILLALEYLQSVSFQDTGAHSISYNSYVMDNETKELIYEGNQIDKYEDNNPDDFDSDYEEYHDEEEEE